MTSDQGILSRIGRLVDEENELHKRPGALSEEEASRLEDIEGELDQCWDLLNQRRALREFGENPEAAKVRSEETVEEYLQ